jgi:hypothetical protein
MIFYQSSFGDTELFFFSVKISVYITISYRIQKVHKELKELGCFSKVNILVDTTCPEDLSPPKYQVRNKTKKDLGTYSEIQRFQCFGDQYPRLSECMLGSWGLMID